MTLRTVNIRTLKDRLSACLRDVQRGDILLVTDRGRVVAELRQPTLNHHVIGSAEDRERQLVERGELELGLPNSPDAYGRQAAAIPPEDIDAALDWTRGDR